MKQRKSLATRALVAVAGTTIAAVLATGGVASATIAIGNDTCDLAGAGTAASPYTVANAEQLQEINDCNAKGYSYYKATASFSITPADSTDWNKAANGGWTPIGSSSVYFQGVFDGNGKTISGMMIDRLGTDYQGLFGFVDNSTIFNVTVAGSVKGRSDVGGLAGYVSNSNVSDAISTVAVTSNGSYAAGLIGETSESSIDGASSSGKVQIDNSVQVTSKYYYGGICGYCYDTSLSNVKSTSIVEAVRLVIDSDPATYSYASYVGGVAGDVEYALVDNAVSSGAVTGEYDVGGIAGYTYYSTVSNSSSSSAVTAKAVNNRWSYVGGAIGEVSTGGVHNVTATGPVKGHSYTGGAIGSASDAGLSNLKATGTVTIDASLNSNKNPESIGGLVGHLRYGSLSGGTTSGALKCGDASTKYQCGFVGGVVGNSNEGAVIGVTSSRSVSTDATGLGSSYSIGGLVGYMYYAGISKSSATGAVTTKNALNIGGLVGYADFVLINKSSATGAVTGVMASGDNSLVRAGGLVGAVEYTFSAVNSFATGNVTVTGTGANGVGSMIGGFDRPDSVTIRDSYARGNASGYNDVAGLIGFAKGGTTVPVTIRNVYVTGTVTASVATGKNNDPILNKDDQTRPLVRGLIYVNGTAGSANTSGAVRKTATALKVTSSMTATQRAAVLKVYTDAGFSSTKWGVSATKNGGFAYLK